MKLGDVRAVVDRAMAPLVRRVRLVVSRAVVRAVNDSLKLQGVQISLLKGEAQDVERFQEYGFTSRPHVGAEAVTVSLGGDRGHTIVIAVDDRRYRLTGLEEGEVALYDDQGSKVVLRRGGILQVFAEQVVLGAEGGAPVGRVGDPVEITFAPGTPLVTPNTGNAVGGTYTGTITGGAARVSAA